MASVALNIIAKNEEKNIARVISSVLPAVDAVYVLDTGSTDKTVEIARSLGANVIEVGERFTHKVTKKEEKWVKDHLGPYTYLKEGDSLFRFAEARNYLLSQTPKTYEWILWLDADDVFMGKENIQEIIKDAVSKDSQMVFLDYLYQCEFNPDGTIKAVIIQHLRERLFRNDGTFAWKGEIHETLVDEKPNRKIDSRAAQVVHMIDNAHMTASIERNIRNLEYEIYVTKAVDPRPIYYLAKAYFDLNDRQHDLESERLIKAYNQGSGWAEERAQAWEYVAWIRNRFRDHKNAVKAVMNSMIEDPKFPSAYITLAQTYMYMGEWEKALHWVKLSAQVPQPATTLIMNPKDLIAKSLEVIYAATLNTNQLDEAWAAMYKIIQLFPDDENIKNNWQMVNNLKTEKELTIKAVELARYLNETGQKEKIRQLILALPDNVAGNQLITAMYQQVFPPRKHGDNEVTIFCGPGFEIWNPKTIEERGSGGSEEAVYRLSKELTQLGYKVTVYADPGDQRGVHDGVDYRNYYELNWMDEMNILISWRRPDAMKMGVRARKHYLWLHDIPNPKMFPAQEVNNIDKVIVLSEYQASLLEPFYTEGQVYGVPREKIWVSRNGVTI